MGFGAVAANYSRDTAAIMDVHQLLRWPTIASWSAFQRTQLCARQLSGLVPLGRGFLRRRLGLLRLRRLELAVRLGDAFSQGDQQPLDLGSCPLAPVEGGGADGFFSGL